jgi:hypothetical protein
MTQKPTTPKIGMEMPDGSVYVGISPETNQPMYATPVKGDVTNLDAHGHQDWRSPTKAELNVLFNSRADIGRLEFNPPSPSGRLLVRSPDAPAR